MARIQPTAIFCRSGIWSRRSHGSTCQPEPEWQSRYVRWDKDSSKVGADAQSCVCKAEHRPIQTRAVTDAY
jgi:hypothetical protein